MRRHGPRHADRRARRAARRPARGRALLPDLCGRGRRHRPRGAARVRHARARRRRDDDRGAPATASGASRCSSDDDRVERLREKPRLDYWINGGFFCFEPGFLDVHGARQRARAGAARAAGRRRASSRAYRHDGFWDCMDTYKDAVDAQRPLGRRRGALADLGAPRRERLGACTRWSPAGAASSAPGLPRRCSSAATRWSSLDRGARERPALRRWSCWGSTDDVSRRRRRPARRRAASRGCSPSTGSDSVFHLAAQTIVGTAHASPVPTFETNVRGTWTLLEACRDDGVERVVVASSDKAYGAHDELPYREDFALQPTAPYEASRRPPT